VNDMMRNSCHKWKLDLEWLDAMVAEFRGATSGDLDDDGDLRGIRTTGSKEQYPLTLVRLQFYIVV